MAGMARQRQGAWQALYGYYNIPFFFTFVARWRSEPATSDTTTSPCTTVAEAVAVAAHVDALLLDSGNPTLAVKELGGTGRTHDWAHSRRIVEACAKPVFLAGGLRPDNLAQAHARVRPFGFDVCSGVRTNDVLDETKLAAFFQAVHAL